MGEVLMPLTLPHNIPLPFWLTVRVRLTLVHPTDSNFPTIIPFKILNTNHIVFNSILHKQKSTSWKEESERLSELAFSIYTTQANSLCASSLVSLIKPDTCNLLQSLPKGRGESNNNSFGKYLLGP